MITMQQGFMLMQIENEPINIDGSRSVYIVYGLPHARFTAWKNCRESMPIWSIFQHEQEVWRGDFADLCLFVSTELQELPQ